MNEILTGQTYGLSRWKCLLILTPNTLNRWDKSVNNKGIGVGAPLRASKG